MESHGHLTAGASVLNPINGGTHELLAFARLQHFQRRLNSASVSMVCSGTALPGRSAVGNVPSEFNSS